MTKKTLASTRALALAPAAALVCGACAPDRAPMASPPPAATSALWDVAASASAKADRDGIMVADTTVARMMDDAEGLRRSISPSAWAALEASARPKLPGAVAEARRLSGKP